MFTAGHQIPFTGTGYAIPAEGLIARQDSTTAGRFIAKTKKISYCHRQDPYFDKRAEGNNIPENFSVGSGDG
jgi:hypothetical protein